MNMYNEANSIYEMRTHNENKRYLLEQHAVDCIGEMDAQSQNMRPEVCNNQAEGLRITQEYLRRL
ncbi:MAG: hypothetical protein O2809_10050 [Proteobacteria bacterium]|nr:hypothetical protein [Pseudomonadota bacterium]